MAGNRMPDRTLRASRQWACPEGLKLIDAATKAVSRSASARLAAAFDRHSQTCYECQQGLTELTEPD